jgi:thiamine pyrophosphokinase
MAATAVIYVGSAPGPQAAPPMPRVEIAIAADSGLAVARRLGHHVDVVVGDLDSVTTDDLAWAERHGAAVERHDADKDLTDFELAVETAVRSEVDRVVVLGGAGGRLDHLAANLAVLGAPLLVEVEVEAWIGTARVTVIRDRRTMAGVPGLILSLLAWGGDVTGVTTDGLRWPLHDATLVAGSAWGTSNEFVASAATVSIERGVLTAITPDVGAICPLVDLSPPNQPPQKDTR